MPVFGFFSPPSSTQGQVIHPPDPRSSPPISYVDDDDSDVNYDQESPQGITSHDSGIKEKTRSRPKPTTRTTSPELTRGGAACCDKNGCVLKGIHPTELLPPHHRGDHGSDSTAVITLPSFSKQPKFPSVSSGVSQLPQLDDDTPTKGNSQGSMPQGSSMRNQNQAGNGNEIKSYRKSESSGGSTQVSSGVDDPSSLTFPAVVKAVRHAEHPTDEGRSLVLCFDGTGDQFDGDNSNVVKFFTCLKKNDKRRQLVYYQAGIGTYLHTQYSIPGMNALSKMADLGIAHSISTHIKGGYHFLQENFTIGDRIILLGFSRGAYTARALAGMLHKVGLLAKGNTEQLPFAYKLYQDSSRRGISMSTEFKRTFSIDVRVHFLGCWDSVSSVGFFRSGNSFPFESGDTTVAYFRHAMALDERRGKFKVGRWERHEWMVETLKNKSEDTIKKIAEKKVSEIAPSDNKKEKDSRIKDGKTSMQQEDMDEKIFRFGYQLSEWGDEEESIEAELAVGEEPESRVKPHNQVIEVWFPGCHCDVGGGAVHNEVSHSLSKIPLRWMIRQTFKCNTGIIYDSACLAALGLDLSTLYPFVKKRKKIILEPPSDLLHIVHRYHSTTGPKRTTDLGYDSGMGGSSLEELRPRPYDVYLGKRKNYEAMTEEEHDYVDSLEGINDELSNCKGWYMLEMFPVAQENYDPETQTWYKTIRPNLGRNRVIVDNRPKFHRSILTRQKKLGYIVKALDPNDGRAVRVGYVE